MPEARHLDKDEEGPKCNAFMSEEFLDRDPDRSGRVALVLI